MFDWDSVPDDIANYVAVEQLSDDEPEPLLDSKDSSTSIARFEFQSANLCRYRLSASISKKHDIVYVDVYGENMQQPRVIFGALRGPTIPTSWMVFFLPASESTSALVPMMEEGFSSSELETIRWMMQKVNLHQDFVDLLDLCIQ